MIPSRSGDRVYSAFLKKQILLIYLLLTVASLLAFLQVSHCDFISYDDSTYVTENVHIRNGISVEAIRWAFTTGYASNWHPLTWLSHMLDVQLFGLDPRWHHLTNLLFHLANTLLLFFVLHRMTRAPWKSAFVAALFAIHPLHVESVAWVAERKDVLSTFFWMLTTGAYIHYVENPRLKNYLVVLILFVLGLMAKPMLVTLPFVLLLLDYWPLQRFGLNSLPFSKGVGGIGGFVTDHLPFLKRTNGDFANHPPLPKGGRGDFKTQVSTSTPNQPVSEKRKKGKSAKRHSTQAALPSSAPVLPRSVLRPLLQEKIPFFALAALSSIVTFIAQLKGGAVKTVDVLPLGVRISNALVSYTIYIGKMLWPTHLAIYYPHPGMRSFWQVLGAVLILGAVSTMVFRTAKRFPYLAVGWLWYAGTLVPVIGIVQVGNQAMADRYTYIPLIGLLIMAAWGIPELLKKWRHHKEALVVSSALILPCLFVATCIQTGYWRNSITLYDHALKVTSRNATMLNNRGVVYSQLGNLPQAVSDYDRAIEINPEYADPYSNRGVAHSRLGNLPQAISDYDRAIEINSEYADAYINRGFAYGQFGDFQQAISDYSRAIEINPEYALAYTNRGVAYVELGNFQQAVSDYDRALEINPEYAMAYINRGIAYAKLGNRGQAIEDLRRAAGHGSEDAKNLLKSEGINW